MSNSTGYGSSRKTQSRTRRGAEPQRTSGRKDAGRHSDVRRAESVSPTRSERADKRVSAMEVQIAERITRSQFSDSEVHTLQQAAMEYIIAFKNGGGVNPVTRHKGAKKAALSGLKGTLHEFADRQFQAAFSATRHIRC